MIGLVGCMRDATVPTLGWIVLCWGLGIWGLDYALAGYRLDFTHVNLSQDALAFLNRIV